MYEYSDYLKCIKHIKKEYEGVGVDKIRDNLHEIYFESKLPFARLIFDEVRNALVLTFNSAARNNDAVLFSADLFKKWKDLKIAPNFYVDVNDFIYIGEDAENQMMIELEEQIVLSFLKESKVSDPIIKLYKNSRKRNPVFTTKLAGLEYLLRMKRAGKELH